jgi:hypothetical protein
MAANNMKPRPKIGQRLFSLNIGYNSSRFNQTLTPVVVVSVGRKYFTVSTEGPYKHKQQYFIEDWREKTYYSQETKLYKDEQEWFDDVLAHRISNKLREVFSVRPNLSLDTLRKIEALVDGTE